MFCFHSRTTAIAGRCGRQGGPLMRLRSSYGRAAKKTERSLSEPMQALTQQVKAYERLTIEAAVHGDRRSGLLALIANPLVGNANLA
ncbi:hypothetical protein ACE04B_35785, partial [Rhizobium phaseoli]